MKYEEMKKIWDSQANEAVYAINEESLRNDVISKKTKIARNLNYSELYFLGLMLFMALMTLIEGILDKEYYQIPESVLLLLAAGNIYKQRMKRIRITKGFGSSLLSDLKQAIRSIDFLIERQKKFVWWFVAPILASQVIHFAYTYQGKPWWLWVLMLVAFTASTILIKMSVKKGALPMKKKLESLQTLLENE